MEKKDLRKLVILFVILLGVGVYVDWSNQKLLDEGVLYRQEVGEKAEKETLEITVEGVTDKLEYTIKVEPIRPTEEQAKEYFEKAIEEIEEDFGKLEEIYRKRQLPLKEEYLDGFVVAEWNMEPWDVIKTDGTIVYEKITEEGCIVNLSVTLTCGTYERAYQFPMEIPYLKRELAEEIVEALDVWMEEEMSQEGEACVVLPQELLGKQIHWRKVNDDLTIRLFFLEIIAVIAIALALKQKKDKEQKIRNMELESDYPEIVSQLVLLLGAGMNTRQAWNIIATRYLDNRQKRAIAKKIAFEGIVKMNRRIQEGENEKMAYQYWAKEMENTSYHRLVRLLIGNLEKGTTGMCATLEQESKQAYEQRILLAKKAGEEASTRMLLPLMLMMIIVMAIVMAPAMMDFMG